jgi:DNA helicase-2/ATP-dependent DNA helicase PcrA
MEAANCPSKYCSILAGAGSGKTLVLTKRIERILSTTSRGEKVLALTFSNKAADELRERLLEVYPPDELRDKAFVGTIHNFCLALVIRRGSSIGLPSDLHVFESYSDRMAVFSEAVEAVPVAKSRFANMPGRDGSVAIRQLFDEMGVAERDRDKRAGFLSDPYRRMVYDEYRARLLAQHAIDFDGILSYATQILLERPSIAKLYQRVYRHICIDEAQDLNYSQYLAIRALAGETSSITMVGDPNQAIYGFNGSSSKILTEEFPHDYPDTKVCRLLNNYRSSASVLRAAQSIEKTFEIHQQLHFAGRVECRSFADEKDEASWVADKIRELIDRGVPDDGSRPIEPREIAVLARNRYALNSLPHELERLRVAFHTRFSSSDADQNESDLFRYFHLGLRLIVNPNDRLHLDQLNQDLFEGERAPSFPEIMRMDGSYDGLSPESSDALRNAWTLLEEGDGFRFQAVLDLFESLCANPGAFASDDDRSIVTEDLNAWKLRWLSYRKGTLPAERSLPGLLRAVALGAATTRERRAGVTLSTVHMAKGLEFEAVFIMGLNQGTFPDYRASTGEKLEEERHSMFVAITRSRRYCYLTRPERRLMPWGEERRQVESEYYAAVDAACTSASVV